MSDSFFAKVIESNRVTIPKGVREKLGIKEGDIVEVVVLRKIQKVMGEIKA